MSESAVRLNEAKPLPQGWRWGRLGEVCEFAYGTGLPEHGRGKGNVPVYGSNGVVGYHNVPITGEPAIIIGRKGSIGATHYSNVACWPIDTTYYIDASKTSCDIPWLFFLLKWLKLEAFNRATGVPGLNRDDAYRQVVPLAPLPEQKRIAAKVQELMEEVEHARTACEVQLEAARALPSTYLRHVFESDEAKKWERKSLVEVCDGDSGIWGDPAHNSPSCYPILRSNNIQDGKMILDDIAIRKVTEPSIIEKKRLRTGDVLVATSSGSKNLLGKSALFVQPSNGQIYLFSNFTMRLRSKLEIIEPHFLYFYLQSPRAKQILIVLQDTTTGLRNLDRQEFLAQTIPAPPLPEQKRIASELKDKITYAEKLKTAVEKQLDAIKALPQAILKKAFSGEL